MGRAGIAEDPLSSRRRCTGVGRGGIAEDPLSSCRRCTGVGRGGCRRSAGAAKMYVCDEAWDRDVWSAEMFQCSLERKIETRLLVTPRLQIGSKSAQINTWIWSRIGRYFSDRFGFQVADLENRRTDANRTRKSGPKSARNRLDRTGLRSQRD